MQGAVGVGAGILKGLGVVLLVLFVVVTGLQECGFSVEKGQASKCEDVVRDVPDEFRDGGVDLDELRAVGWAACMDRNGWTCRMDGFIPTECRHFEDVADNPFVP